jgi:hypothetical protein
MAEFPDTYIQGNEIMFRSGLPPPGSYDLIAESPDEGI